MICKTFLHIEHLYNVKTNIKSWIVYPTQIIIQSALQAQPKAAPTFQYYYSYYTLSCQQQGDKTQKVLDVVAHINVL